MKGPCSVPGCGVEAYARSLCEMHYQQVRRHGAVQPAERLCDCGAKATRRGMCAKHYQRRLRERGGKAQP